MTIVDLSVPLEASPSEPVRPQVDFEDHDRSRAAVAGIFGCAVSQLPDGKGWASETVTAITHAGTHVDAPYHYFPTCGGERARTIDELPLDWFLAPGVRLDLRGLERGAEITVARPRGGARTATRSRRWRSSCCGRAPRTRGAGPTTRTRAPAWAVTARCGCSTAA